MPQAQYPGVFREEVTSETRVPPAISAANFAVVAPFERGPVDEAVLVTSLEEAREIFGPFTSKSLGMTTLAAYYANGGTNAYVIRVAGPNAARASRAFVDRRLAVLKSSTGGGSTDSLTVDAQNNTPAGFDDADLPLEPGSVQIRVAEHQVVTGETVGPTSNGDTTFDDNVANVPVFASTGSVTGAGSPGSVGVTLPLASGGSTPITDDPTIHPNGPNTGQLGGGTTEVDESNSYINYETGNVHVELSSDQLDGSDVTADYTYLYASQVTGEVLDQGVQGTSVYHLSINNVERGEDGADLYADANIAYTRISWTDAQGNTRSATVDSITNDVAQLSGDVTPESEINLETGEVFLEPTAGNEPAGGETISIDYWYQTYLAASDDGQGTIDGPLLGSSQSIDYADGQINGGNSFNTVALNRAGADIELVYAKETHKFRARNPGDFANDIRVRIAGDDDAVAQDTGDYDTYTVIVEELGKRGQWVPTERFEQVVLDDLSDVDHVAQEINDQFQGSDVVEVTTDFSNDVPDELDGSRVDGNQSGLSSSKSQILGRGTGSVEDVVGQLKLTDGDGELSRKIVPGSVTIEYTSGAQTKTVTDDGLGNLEGAVDGGATATVDYETGTVQFRPSSAPDNNTDITSTHSLLSPAEDVPRRLQGGADDGAVSRDQVSDITLRPDERGIYALEDVNLPVALSCPDFAGNTDVQGDMISYLEDRELSIALVSPPQGASVDEAREYKRQVLASQSDRGAMYHPHVDIEDPVTNKTASIPPFGHVAGVWARTDANHNVGKAPAGIVDGALRYFQSLSQTFQASDIERLYQVNINPLWKPPEQPTSVWGARTMQTGGEYRYIQARRTIDLIAVLMQRSMWWVPFETIGPGLFQSIREQGRQILRRFFNDDVLEGQSEEEAFFVKVDSENNPPAAQRRGEVIMDWGAATNEPGEFLTQRHRQIIG